MSHKFSLGQAVMLTAGAGAVFNSVAVGKITRLLPKEGTEYQYHIRIEPDGIERRVWESQLRPVSFK